MQHLRAGDILFAMSSGSRHLVGKSARIGKDLETGFGAFCGVLRPFPQISNEYLFWVYQTRDFRRAVSEVSKGGHRSRGSSGRKGACFRDTGSPPWNGLFARGRVSGACGRGVAVDERRSSAGDFFRRQTRFHRSHSPRFVFGGGDRHFAGYARLLRSQGACVSLFSQGGDCRVRKEGVHRKVRRWLPHHQPRSLAFRQGHHRLSGSEEEIRKGHRLRRLYEIES